MQKQIIFEEGNSKWIVLGRDPKKPSSIIDTNEYVIISDGEAILLDPGGIEIFPTVLTAVSEIIELKSIRGYLCSHQDPDIMSSLPLWLGLTPEAKIYMSRIWGGFVAHFGQEYTPNFVLVEDGGTSIELGSRRYEIVPAHFCHSSGNFNFYDPGAKILFSGDLGAALVPPDAPTFVEDFNEHIKYMEGFHRRWMPSNEAKNNWVRRIRKLAPKMICPQHGSIFTGKNVENFLDWLEELEVGQLKIRNEA